MKLYIRILEGVISHVYSLLLSFSDISNKVFFNSYFVVKKWYTLSKKNCTYNKPKTLKLNSCILEGVISHVYTLLLSFSDISNKVVFQQIFRC